MKCAECVYYFQIREADDEQPGGGQCRRHAPAVGFVAVPRANMRTGEMGVAIERCAAFPTVAADVWCGEFQLPQRREPNH